MDIESSLAAADVVVAPVGRDGKARPLAEPAHLPRPREVAVRHVYVSAPFDPVQPRLRDKLDDPLDRELTKRNRHQSGPYHRPCSFSHLRSLVHRQETIVPIGR